MCRELTRDERKTIRRLVTGMCANYDSDYGCLPLDCPCYMLGKWWTGSLCRYFRAAVLPLAPVLEASLTGEAVGPETRRCAVCGRAFIPEGRQAYCSETCKAEGNRRRSRERMRKKRLKTGAAVTIRPRKPPVSPGPRGPVLQAVISFCVWLLFRRVNRNI